MAARRLVVRAGAAHHEIEVLHERVAMDKAQLILYGVATYLAIKSLVSLMSDHRQTYKKKLAEELKASAAAAPAAAVPTARKIAPPANPRAAAASQPAAALKNAAKNPVNNPAKTPAKNPVNETAKPVAAKAG